ncbi:MAG: cyclase family protein [SAR202 cluster bacterium]|nr:MAG: cyclase family protein [SAR202 cluster bacterium]
MTQPNTRRIPDEAQVLDWMESLSNWGRWGEDDQLGCLNLITQKKRIQAAALVQDGIPVSCARPISTDMNADVTFQVQRFMVDSGEGRMEDSPERQYARRGAAEFIGMVFHGQSITHIDAMSHYSWKGNLYNGKPANLITSRQGAQTHSIEAAYSGIITKGILLDLPKLRGVEYLDPNEPVMPLDLLEAEKAQGVKIEEGDILLVRTGNYKMRLANPPAQSGEPMTACQVACTPLFKERGIAMLGTDTSNDFRPSHYSTVGSPLHTMCLVTMGLWLIDNANLEELSEACARRNRYEFMLTLAPLRLRNVTGSPVSPIALF